MEKYVTTKSAFEKIMEEIDQKLAAKNVKLESQSEGNLIDRDNAIIAFEDGDVFFRKKGRWYNGNYGTLKGKFQGRGAKQNRELWVKFLEKKYKNHPEEKENFKNWLSKKGAQPSSVTYTNLVKAGIKPTLCWRILSDVSYIKTSTDFDNVRVFVLPIFETNEYILSDKSGRFESEKELSAANIEKLSQFDCEKILRNFESHSQDTYSGIYTIEELQNEYNFALSDIPADAHYIKFIKFREYNKNFKKIAYGEND